MDTETHLQLAGSIREFAPSVDEISPGAKTQETKDLLKRGQLMWAGDEFLRPGLYMWTGEVYILIESKENILVKMEAALGSVGTPLLKEDFHPPKEEE